MACNRVPFYLLTERCYWVDLFSDATISGLSSERPDNILLINITKCDEASRCTCVIGLVNQSKEFRHNNAGNFNTIDHD